MHLKNIGFVKTQKYDTQLERNHNNTFLHLALGYACLKSKCKIIEMFHLSWNKVELQEPRHSCPTLTLEWCLLCWQYKSETSTFTEYIWCHFIGRFNGDQYVCMHSRSGSVWPITILENNALIGQRRCDLHSMTGATQTMTPLEFRLSR